MPFRVYAYRDMTRRGETGGAVAATALARGERLRDARVRAGLDVHEAAKRLRVRPQTVYRWEWGECCPALDSVPEIAAVYGTSSGWIVAGESPRRRRSA